MSKETKKGKGKDDVPPGTDNKDVKSKTPELSLEDPADNKPAPPSPPASHHG